MDFNRFLLRLRNMTIRLDSHFENFLNTHFVLTEIREHDMIRFYSSEKLLIRIIKDLNKNQSVDISTSDQPYDWFYLGALRSVILNNDDYIIRNDSDFSGDFNFLINKTESIILALNKENYSETKGDYEKVLQKRSDRIFGPVNS